MEGFKKKLKLNNMLELQGGQNKNSQDHLKDMIN